MNIAIGRSGIRLCTVASFWDSVKETYDSHELRTEVVLDDNNSKTYYEQLFAQKEKIENEMGEPLNWHNPTDKRVCRIYLRCGADLENRDDWSKQHSWLLEKLELLYKVFVIRVKNLTTDMNS